MSVSLNVNGKTVQLDADPEMPLLWVLREKMGLNGTKFGCGVAQCGACTVHFNGDPVPSCQLTLGAAADGDIVTIEGLSADGSHPLQKAWIENDVPQCGYCQSGMIMAAAALLDRIPKPTEIDINENITNICRCGTYVRIRKAILQAAEA
ncbi:(2Fe-2S)-binding protein [Sphingosinicella xenopeptidilytica]|uniref:(2Fe-2S)-binding protein n=1 Tax=Sphingosinicella xenopeptidilytica TaxID=364098 RepID=A0ABW3C689_SPHXN